MRRALEIVFRQWRLFVLLLILLPVLSLAIGFTMPQSYQASATLWAANRFNSTNAASAPQWYVMLSDTTITPSQAEAAALTELLGSRTFALQVAHAAGLSEHTSGATTPQQVDNALFAEISHNVKVQSVGNNIVTITYTNANAQLATKVVAATMQTFATTTQQLALQTAKELLSADQTSLSGLQKSADDATAALYTFLSQHRSEASDYAKLNADANYQYLSAQVASAKQNVADVQSQVNQLQIQIATIGSQPDAFFTVQDAPTAVKASRTMILLLALAVGLAVALVISIVYVALLMRADHSAYSAADLTDALSVPVLAEIPTVAYTPPVRTIFAILESQSSTASPASLPANHAARSSGR